MRSRQLSARSHHCRIRYSFFFRWPECKDLLEMMIEGMMVAEWCKKLREGAVSGNNGNNYMSRHKLKRPWIQRLMLGFEK